MSLFQAPIRPPAILSDEAIERYVAAIRAEIDPDPQFRRRLRGIVVNTYVAAREGLAPAAPARSMGRLGRACLYASFVLGLSVSSVMAASESAIPGDILYPLKRQIEALRMEVLPVAYHPALLAHDLTERISELDALVDREDWDGAAALAPVVARDLEMLGVTGEPIAAIDRQLAVLEALLERLPEQARAAITRAIEVSGAGGSPAGGPPSTSGGAGAPSAGGAGSGPSGEDRPSPGQPGDVGQGNGPGTEPGQGNGSGQGRPDDPGSNGQGPPDGSGANGGPPVEPKPTKSPKPEKSPAP